VFILHSSLQHLVLRFVLIFFSFTPISAISLTEGLKFITESQHTENTTLLIFVQSLPPKVSGSSIKLLFVYLLSTQLEKELLNSCTQWRWTCISHQKLHHGSWTRIPPSFHYIFSIKGGEISPHPPKNCFKPCTEEKSLKYKAWKIFQTLNLCKQSD